MSVIFERSQSRINRINSELQAPKGWFTAEELESNVNNNDNGTEVTLYVKEHLPMAAKRAERLIAALKDKFNIDVPESYLRVRLDDAFHVLMLISQDDYSSPKIAAARILAEEYARTANYDIAFTFAVLSQVVVDNNIIANGYKLKHVEQQYNQGVKVIH